MRRDSETGEAGDFTELKEISMKIREQAIQALEGLSAAELMLVHEWIDQLRTARQASRQTGHWKISYEELHAATRRCRTSFSEELLQQREERM